MKIAEAAKASGLSPDTIRFYDRSGLLPALARGADGHRRFAPVDLQWLRMFERLRATDMPLAEIKRYVELSRQGDATSEARRRLLEAHALRLDAAQREIDACRALIADKIKTYRARERNQPDM